MADPDLENGQVALRGLSQAAIDRIDALPRLEGCPASRRYCRLDFHKLLPGTVKRRHFPSDWLGKRAILQSEGS